MSEVLTVSRLLTAKEVAKWLNVSAKSVHRWAAANELESVRFGDRTVRFEKSAVERYILESRGVGA